MGKYTIADISPSVLPDKELKKIYEEQKNTISSKGGTYPDFNFTDLDFVFTIAYSNRSLFPNIITGKKPTPKDYIFRWITSYCNAITNPPSKKIASKKSSCNDPMIKTIIKSHQRITDVVAESQITTHNLCMSAENILGNLLEEYIAQKIRPYKWIWCAGETLRAIDFCSEDGTNLLQIKNKNNSENSSSNKIRAGTPIKKWHRLGSSKQHGVATPAYKWEKLNTIINSNVPSGMTKINLTEDDFQKYIINVVTANKNIITGA